jgi:hypothetical protein
VKAGGSFDDFGSDIVVNGTNIYVTGTMISRSAAFGGTTLTNSNASQEIFLTKLIDGGTQATFSWAQRQGGLGDESSSSLVVAGNTIYMAGYLVSYVSSFGGLTVNTSSNNRVAFLASFTDDTPLALAGNKQASQTTIYPNPALNSAMLSGAIPGTTIEVVDILGRHVVIVPVDATGSAKLPDGLVPGLYLVQVGATTLRWTVE